MGLLTCALRLLDHRREERQIRLLPLHRVQGHLRKQLRPRGAAGGIAGRRDPPSQITSAIAEDLAAGLRGIDHQAEERRRESPRQLDQRRRTVVSKLDRGYDDFVSGRISEEFWTRKSQEWEAELAMVDADRPRLEQPRLLTTATAGKILELAKRAEFL
jgi:hypothetical protein